MAKCKALMGSAVKGLTSQSTPVISGTILHARWPNQQCQSTEGNLYFSEDLAFPRNHCQATQSLAFFRDEPVWLAERSHWCGSRHWCYVPWPISAGFQPRYDAIYCILWLAMSTICLRVIRTAPELITNRTEMLYQKRDITDPKTDTTACNRTTQADADGLKQR